MRHGTLGIAMLASVLTVTPGVIGQQEGDEGQEQESASTLGIGDPAPPLVVSEWIKVKGEPIEQFEDGQTYVVEFWATWCGPCIDSIPHLTELAQQYRDQGVRFIGVDVWEHDPDAVRPFVEQRMGDSMDYDVVRDQVPVGEDPDEGALPGEGIMARTWLRASGRVGIPATFVVKDGMIAWIGHPMGLDEPLAKIVAGDWDLEAAAEKLRVAVVEMEARNATYERVLGPLRRGEFKEALSAIDAVVAEQPEMAGSFGFSRFQALVGDGQLDEAVALVHELADEAGESAVTLNNLAWIAVDPEREGAPDPRLVAFAVKTARRAYELSGDEEPTILDTYAWTLYRSGDLAKAIEIQEKAIRLVSDYAPNQDTPELKALQTQLDRYKSESETISPDDR